VPNDATLLFTNAGMVQFKDIFTGAITPQFPKATTSQTCLRAGGKHNDLENVGFTNRHHTFFEMLGNFSFGDYFKEEAIAYAWEFITKVVKLPIDKLWVTVHDSDDEAYEIWKKFVNEGRIKRFGDKDNFWQMGDTGPCGPCSEVFYDQGKEQFSSSEDYLGGDGDRFLEIWNLVFMQYEKDKKGNLSPLPKPSIDTGMGLERMVAVVEGKPSNYDTTLFMPIINKISQLTNKTYEYKSGASYRVIADHIRSVSFLLAQGVNFDKEGRGYVLRRILRRAVRHGYLLGLTKPFMYELVDVLVDIMGEAYPYLEEKQENIKELIKLEEERFFSTIGSGIEIFNKELENTQGMFSGEVAFKLYDTFGFPLDLTGDMLKESGKQVDIDTFEKLMNEQRQRAKASWKGSGDDTISNGDFKTLLDQFGANEFIGYSNLTTQSKVLALLDENFKQIKSLSNGQSGWVMLDKTPLYAKGGGQDGDTGGIENIATIEDTQKFFELNLSKIKTHDTIKIDDIVSVSVSSDRFETAKHHTATHILHSALSKVLGDHVEQAGSLVQPNRLRFDFSHPKALSSEQLEKIQDLVNENILAGLDVQTDELAIDEAKKKGAKALFGEKYGDVVRVVSVDQFSVELCGGTHVQNSSQIGTLIITKESGVSAGVRRIEAVTGKAAYDFVKKQSNLITDILSKVKHKDALLGIEKLQEQIKSLKQENQSLQNQSKEELSVQQINGLNVVVQTVKNGDIKQLIDEAKNKYENLAIMLFQIKGDKVLLAAGSNTPNVKAGNWIKETAPILGGGGGGRPDFAQAGGKDASKIDQAMEKALEVVRG
jgi:alanyl-tRNA synthetase